MKLGMCVLGYEPEKIKLVAETGYDYIEARFEFFCKSSDEDLEAYCKCLEENNIKAEAANCFIPGSMKLTGDDIDYDALSAHVEKGMSRGVKAGLKTVVLGSGGARNVPEGYPYEKAARQIVFFLKNIVAPIASKYGITVVIEPLKDSNIINTVKESCIFAAMADSACIKGLSDSYHMYSFGDSFDNIRDVKGFLGHAHVAEPRNRVFPFENDSADYKTYIDNLVFAECPRCSVEAACENFEKESVEAFSVIKKVLE